MKTLLTMADIAARRGTDKEVGLVQQIVNWAPEITTVLGRTVPGTFATAKIQTAIAAGGAFRPVNRGISGSAGTYEKRRFNAFYFDAQLQVDEAELIAAEQEGDSLGDLQSDEVAGALQNKAIIFSQQFYRSLSDAGADPNGFPGIKTFWQMANGTDNSAGIIDSRTGKKIINFIDAGGTSGATECVWYLWVHPQGVHFLFGGNKTIDVNPWVWQYVDGPLPGGGIGRLRASLSNIAGWIGLMCAHPWAVACIKNIDNTAKWTDAMSAQLHALLPMGIMPTHCFATKRAIAGLQQGRTVTLFGQGSTRPNQPTIAPVPTTDIMGVPIIPTDGIQLTAKI